MQLIYAKPYLESIMYAQNLQFQYGGTIIISTGGIRFSVRYAASFAAQIFGVNALRGKLHHLGSPNLQDIFIGGKLLWDWN